MLEKYREVSSRSCALWGRALSLFPGAVSHNIRTFGTSSCDAYPPFIRRGKGSHIWDVDGNEYVDWWMTHYSLILGHNHPKVRKAIQDQLEYGYHFGAPNEPQVLFGEKVQRVIPFMVKMRFTATGSESTMYAVRVARLFTGKSLVGKACGGWHGGNDSLCYHLKHPYADHPFCEGVSFDFNDRESFDKMLREHGKDLAAVIVEPVIGAGGGLPPEPGFLSYLREETEERGILLIFDEIITGLRLCYGSAGKKVFGVKPDLITLGKIAASGMPLGMYGGREDVMRYASPQTPGSRWVGGGTYSSHPLSMVAGATTLEQLQSLKDKYSTLNRNGDKLRERLNNLFETEEVNALATGFGSINFIHWFKQKLGKSPLTPRMIGENLDHHKLDLFQSLLIEQGVFGYHGLGALSFTHSGADVEKTIAAISKVVDSLKKETFNTGQK